MGGGVAEDAVGDFDVGDCGTGYEGQGGDDVVG